LAVTNGKGDLPLNFLIQRGSVLTLLGIVENFVPTYVKLFPKFSYQKLSTSTDFDRVFRKISADVFSASEKEVEATPPGKYCKKNHSRNKNESYIACGTSPGVLVS